MAKKPEPGPKGFPATIDTQTLAEIIGITGRRLNQLVTDLRIPAECRIGDSHWDTLKTITEIFGYYRRASDHARPIVNVDLETRILEEDLRKKRIDNARKVKELLPRHVYVQVWGELISAWKNRWATFGATMGPRVFRAKDKLEATLLLDDKIAEIFDGLNDPKAMEDIESRITDHDFHADTPADRSSEPSGAGARPPAGALVP